jgi:hypothetical protein
MTIASVTWLYELTRVRKRSGLLAALRHSELNLASAAAPNYYSAGWCEAKSVPCTLIKPAQQKTEFLSSEVFDDVFLLFSAEHQILIVIITY